MTDRPIYDSWSREYKSQFGAIKRADFCTFRLNMPDSMTGEPVFVIYREGFKVKFLPMRPVPGGQISGRRLYEVEYCPNYVGVHYYYFTVLEQGERKCVKRAGAHIGSFEGTAPFQLTVYDERFATPDFIKGGVLYQIFPDRFYKSGKAHDNIPAGRVLREDWGGVPAYKPDADGVVRNNDYFGGDLDGIIEKLPYLRSLGVTCLYLNPIFEAHENHRYNTADYERVDPLLGTNGDFARLCERALEHGIRVILDGVFNHTGADSVYFNKLGRYDSVGAYQSPESPYYGWYTFGRYPDAYESWWGISTLPNVNETNEAYLRFICGENGVLRKWLGLGASGWRLDVADELPDAFLDSLRKTVKGADNGGENLIIGEVWEDASNKESYGVKRRYLLGDQLDSVMNYPFKEAILDYACGGAPEEFLSRVMAILENYPKPSVDALMNSLSTHDTERALTRLAGACPAGDDRDKQAAYILDEERRARALRMLRGAMVLQFFLPGVPCVYYGDEAGMEGFRDPFNRGCYPWGGEDERLIAFTRELAATRLSLPVLRRGAFEPILFTQDMAVFARVGEGGEAALVMLNKSGAQQALPPRLFDGYTDITPVTGLVGANLAPYSYAVCRAVKL